MTRLELDELLKLPEHIIVEVQFRRPDKKQMFKCGFPLTMIEIKGELDEVIGTQYSGQDYAVVKAADIGRKESEFFTGRIIRIVENHSDRVPNWLVSKIDSTLHKEYTNQESRIDNLHAQLDVIWNGKQGTTKLDILFDELIAKEQEEANAINPSTDE